MVSLYLNKITKIKEKIKMKGNKYFLVFFSKIKIRIKENKKIIVGILLPVIIKLANKIVNKNVIKYL